MASRATTSTSWNGTSLPPPQYGLAWMIVATFSPASVSFGRRVRIRTVSGSLSPTLSVSLSMSTGWWIASAGEDRPGLVNDLQRGAVVGGLRGQRRNRMKR